MCEHSSITRESKKSQGYPGRKNSLGSNYYKSITVALNWGAISYEYNYVESSTLLKIGCLITPLRVF